MNVAFAGAAALASGAFAFAHGRDEARYHKELCQMAQDGLFGRDYKFKYDGVALEVTGANAWGRASKNSITVCAPLAAKYKYNPYRPTIKYQTLYA